MIDLENLKCDLIEDFFRARVDDDVNFKKVGKHHWRTGEMHPENERLADRLIRRIKRRLEIDQGGDAE